MLVIVSTEQARKAFEHAAYISAANMLFLYSFKNIMRYYATLAAIPPVTPNLEITHGHGKVVEHIASLPYERNDALQNAAQTVTTDAATLGAWTHYQGHLDPQHAAFIGDDAAPLAPPARDVQIRVVQLAIDALRP